MAVKGRGTKLGTQNGAAALRRAGKGTMTLAKVITDNAEAFARELAPLVEEIRAAGCKSLRSIAAELNVRGNPNPLRRVLGRFKRHGSSRRIASSRPASAPAHRQF